MFVFPGDRKDNTIGIHAVMCHLVSLLLSEANSEPEDFTFQQALGKIRGLRVYPISDSERNVPGEHTDSLMHSQSNQEADCMYVYRASCLFSFSLWDKFYRTKAFVHDFCKVIRVATFPMCRQWLEKTTQFPPPGFSQYLPISLTKPFLYDNTKQQWSYAIIPSN